MLSNLQFIINLLIITEQFLKPYIFIARKIIRIVLFNNKKLITYINVI